MQTGIIQPKTETTLKTAPRMRSLLPYALVFFACCSAIVLPMVLAMRGPDGTFEPANLSARLAATPRWLHGGMIVMLLAFMAVEFDFLGRLLAFLIVRIAFARTVTWRRLAAVRVVILAALLAWTMLGIALWSWPAPHGWMRPAFFGVLIAPIVLSAIEWMRSES